MDRLDFLEELTEQEESLIQGGRTDLLTPFGNFQLTGNPTLPNGAFYSFPLAFAFRPGTVNFGAGFGIKFSVAQKSDVPLGNILSGPSAFGANGLAGLLGLNTSPNIA
ncbi:MAG: hypothetical protein HC771_07985 [Synechococcales cyanobacterium CRU_2_2]|nr:hypothetical protein [Synechococcales cyanobacterium CRU_2_2]